MTCRIARASARPSCLDFALCCACGSANLEVCATSKILGPHMCGNCTHARGEHGLEMRTTGLQEVAALTTSADISVVLELQIAT